MFRKSGSVTLLQFEGALPEAGSSAFSAALQARRFRTIEHAASEESSAGWVSPADPTGDSFDPASIVTGDAWWLRIRFDRKVLPPAWLAIYRVAAEASAGRKLTPRERRELRADLCEKLLPRILPAVRFVDVLVVPREKRVLLFSTSAATQAAFGELFEHSFDVHVTPAEPGALAARADLGPDLARQLADVRPVRWPRGDERLAAQHADHDDHADHSTNGGLEAQA